MIYTLMRVVPQSFDDNVLIEQRTKCVCVCVFDISEYERVI